MLFSHWRDAAQVGLIRIKITPGQLTPLTIKNACVFSVNRVDRGAPMCLFCPVHN